MISYGILLFLLLLAGCIDGQNMQNLSEEQKSKIENVIKTLLVLESQNAISPNSIVVKIISHRYDSDLLFVNASIFIQNNKLADSEFIFSKDMKYFIYGVPIQIDKLLSETSISETQTMKTPDINLADIPYKGDVNAKIKLVEFSDFECPFCKRFYDTSLKQITKDWIDTGKVVMYYMHFPLEQIHPKAEPAARASYCAYRQGKFWEYHDLLFERLAGISNTLEGYKGLAQELGLDLDAFEKCYNSDDAKNRVQYEANIGMQLGVRGTPSFLIIVDKSVGKDKVNEAAKIVRGQVLETDNNYMIFFSGAYPYSQFNSVFQTLSS